MGTPGGDVEDFTEIDGSIMEGGGQILRMASALCCLLRQNIQVNKIRAGRSNPGLRPQHLTGLRLVNQLCHGKLKGAEPGSMAVTLIPKCLKGGNYTGDTKTAGSVALLLQVALPCLLYADGESILTLKGGTDADMAPPMDYFTQVFSPIAAKFGVKFECSVIRRGYYPKGGGEAHVKIWPVKCLKSVILTDRGPISKIFGKAFTAGGLHIGHAEKMAQEAFDFLKDQPECKGITINIDVVKEPESCAVGSGAGIFLIAETKTGCRLAGSALGKKGVPFQKTGKDAASQLLGNIKHGGCVDDYLQDQLILLMALAEGTSKVLSGPITLHTQTAIHIAKCMTNVKFTVEQLTDPTGRPSDQYLIECDGMGLANKSV